MPAGNNRTLQIGLLSALIVVALIGIGYFAWGEIARGNATRTVDKPVSPGMYDFREEARKGNLGKRTEVEVH